MSGTNPSTIGPIAEAPHVADRFHIRVESAGFACGSLARGLRATSGEVAPF